MAKEKSQLERISEQVHDTWVEWTKSIQRRVKPIWRNRWRDLWVPYDELPEFEKDKDRKFGRRIQKVVKSSRDSFAFRLGAALSKRRDPSS